MDKEILGFSRFFPFFVFFVVDIMQILVLTLLMISMISVGAFRLRPTQIRTASKRAMSMKNVSIN